MNPEIIVMHTLRHIFLGFKLHLRITIFIILKNSISFTIIPGDYLYSFETWNHIFLI